MCRVVSLPAVVSRMNIDAELLLGEPRAVELGLDELRRDVVARLAAPLLAELPAVLDQVERERARERQLAELGVA